MSYRIYIFFGNIIPNFAALIYFIDMEINLRSGIDKLLFGMQEEDVTLLYGKPSRTYKDEDKNTIYLYNDKKLRLTFYADEDFRLGYIIASGKDLKLFGQPVIGNKWEALTKVLLQNNVKDFEQENYDSVENFFNEANWAIFQVEYGEVIRVEVGATINSNDEFDWKF